MTEDVAELNFNKPFFHIPRKLQPHTSLPTSTSRTIPNLNMIFVTPQTVAMATAIRASPRRLPPGTSQHSPQTSSRLPNTLSTDLRPLTTFDDDRPGNESLFGPRHDNDHVYIKDIQILPTTDEILCIERPYMPRKDLCEPHYLSNGIARHLDMLFRHLRFDNTEILRDTCYHAAQNLASSDSRKTVTSEPRRETTAGNRYFEYQAVRLEEIHINENKGIIIRLSYGCPEFMRGKLIRDCGRLLQGMLCALICLNQDSELSIVFLEVHQRQSTQSMESLGGLGKRAAVELSFTASAPFDDILKITTMAQGLSSPRLTLVEFPKLLYAGFYWTLRRLQEMSPGDIAFEKYIAPSLNGVALQNAVAATSAGLRNEFYCNPPAYANDPGLSFDFDPISSKPASFNISQLQNDPERFISFLQQNTTLDDGQAVALQQNLTREFAFTQGPPGTGKTFLGIAIARILLASRTNRTAKPLLVVCQTNHALDSFLAELRDAGIKLDRLVRVGSGSKEEWTTAINLREKSRKVRMLKDNSEETGDAWRHRRALFSDIDSWCKGLNAERTTQTISWHAVSEFLEEQRPEVRQQFVTAATNKQTEGFTYDYWAAGGDLKNLKDLQEELSERLLGKEAKRSPLVGSIADVEQVLTMLTREAERRSKAAGEGSVWKMPISERRRLLSIWRQQVDREDLAEQLAALHLEYIAAGDIVRKSMNEKDVTVCLEADVIGMTTTASATRWDLLKMIGFETIICEEAGEVLEANSLCSLVPGLKHAVFIGDPLQLRPEVAEQTLSLETPIGRNYRLDESMFERFMLPRDLASSLMPTSQLSVQRRMHPEIADITRLMYPNLLDHDSTSLHAPVFGFSDRMFWLDHRIPEDDTVNESKSYVNSHEVALVAGLVRYLLTRNTYSLGDIAILTPYNGQLAALVEALKTTCAIWLSPKDREALLDDGVIPLDAEKRGADKDNVNMAELLRIATVDNFQGEEAKVIILSTVRSGGRPGFLKTVNRVNVACSRARDGFYIIGNAQTLKHVPFWTQIINVFAQRDKIGPKLRLCCDRHPQHYTDVSRPQDFDSIQECQIPCTETLNCLHSCFQPCHDPAAHDRIPCRKPCKKILNCGHKCQKMCFEQCRSCEYQIGEQKLPCGHQVAKVCGGSTPKCLTIVRREILPCNHAMDVRCFERDGVLVCNQPCATALSCDHACSGKCKDCFPEGKHPPCPQLCQKPKACGHRCLTQCHGDTPCPMDCSQPCLLSCEHGPCKGLCKRVCDPCVKPFIGNNALVTSNGPIICSLGHTVPQLDKFEHVFDRLLAKMGRKYGQFAFEISKRERDLQQSLEPLLKSIRPDVMAQEFNKRNLTARGGDLRKVMNDVVEFRKHVVDPFEHSIGTLRQLVPAIPEYTLLFHLRLDILEYRARAILVLDSLKVAQFLTKLNDASMGVQRQAEIIQAIAVQDCVRSIEYCKASLARSTASSPCVQVELLLQQIQFAYLADVSSESAGISAGYVEGVLSTATLLCRRYPNTAGAFLDNVGEFRNYAETQDPAMIPPVTSTKGRKVERAWGQHAVGHLKSCSNKHPYSTETFPQGCPECGTEVELEEEVFARTQKFLQEDAFLKAMRLR